MNILQQQAEIANLPLSNSLLAAPSLHLASHSPMHAMDDELIMALNGSSFARQPQLPSYPTPSQTNFPQFLPEEEVIRALNTPSAPHQWPASLQRFNANPCTRYGPQALSHAPLWVLPSGEFDHLLYNYLLMVTVDRRAATNGLRQRLPALTTPPSSGAAAPTRGSSSNLTDPNNVTWSVASAGSGGSSTPSRREPRRGSSQCSSQSSNESSETNKMVQQQSRLSSSSRDPSP